MFIELHTLSLKIDFNPWTPLKELYTVKITNVIVSQVKPTLTNTKVQNGSQIHRHRWWPVYPNVRVHTYLSLAFGTAIATTILYAVWINEQSFLAAVVDGISTGKMKRKMCVFWNCKVRFYGRGERYGPWRYGKKNWYY